MFEIIRYVTEQDPAWRYLLWVPTVFAFWCIWSDAASDRITDFIHEHDETLRASTLVAIAPAIMLALDATISYCTEANLRTVCGDDLWEYCWWLFGCWQVPNAPTAALWLLLP